MDNQPEFYAQWAAYHCEVFGLGDRDLKTLLSWRELFLTAGYQAGELRAATDAIALDPGSLGGMYQSKMTAHLTAIQSRIRNGRAIVLERSKPSERERGTCTKCGGCGYVTVPHPASIRDGEWKPMLVARANATYYTAAVVCSCALGRWLVDNGKTKRRRTTGTDDRILRLEDYERINPDWQEQLAAHRKMQRLRANAVDSERQVKESKEHNLAWLASKMAREPGGKSAGLYEAASGGLNNAN